MSTITKRRLAHLFLSLTLVFSFAFLAACSSADEDEEPEHMMEEGEMEEMEHGEHEHAEDDHADRIPNNGAVITILSPEDGATFAENEDIVIEVEVENFELGAAGNHWHIAVNGTEWSMVMTASTDEVIRGLEPGMHEIEVLLANGEHQDLEEGDTIMITIE